MPDANYNTRLRTNAQIMPPRRLRQSPCPPPRRPRSHKHRSQPPTFPPPTALINHDDVDNKTFLAVGRALSSIQNRAITIKDLSRLVREHGLSCQNVSAASQAITTFIRQHLQRCREDGSPPLLLSVVLTGIREYDDPLAPALHSRSGGNSPQVTDTAQALTKFRKGTTVWFLSPAAGAPCPFAREGISVDDIMARPPHGTKRKRDSQSNGPRKMQASSPAMATRHRPCEDVSLPSHPRIKLTLRVRPPEPESDSEPHSSSESGNESTDSDNEVGAEIPRYSESGSDISDEFGSDADSSMDLDDTDRVSSEDLSGYPFTPCIPTPNYSTPLTSLPSSTVPCGPLSPYLRSNLCSSHFIKSTFTSFRTSWSNPPDDRATSLPFSAASSPDSEDEDEDYHNSMVGMRRDLSLKEEEDDEQNVPMFEPIVPKYVPGGVHYVKPPSSMTSDSPDWSSSKQEVNSETVSTPLETLPGFLSLVEPMSSQISIKEEEPASAILPSSDTWVNVKIEEEVDHNDSQGSLASPVSVDDVEVLGPESVRIREWDAAWNAAGHVIDLDEVPLSPPPSEHQSDSPPVSLLTSPMSRASMPLKHEYISIDKTVIDGVPVYRTFLAPGLPLLRRADNSHINLNPLIAFLNISLAALFVHVTAPRMTVSSADGPLGGTWVPLSVADKAIYPFDAKLPPRLREVFLVTDIEKMAMYSAKEAKRLYGDEESLRVNASSFSHTSDDDKTLGTDASIRVEDLFEGDHLGGHTPRHSSSGHELWWEAQGSSAYFSVSAVRAGTPVESLNEQEERIFYSLVDVLGPATSQQQQQSSSSVQTTTPRTPPPKLYTCLISDLCSPLSTPPSSPVSSRGSSHALIQDKENVNVSKRPRRKRDKTEKAPLRRSTRMSSKQTAAGPTTRRRSRKAQEHG